MKVVCIIVLFVIVAAKCKRHKYSRLTRKIAKGTKEKKEILKFPRFIPNPKEFATELLDIWQEKQKRPPSDYNAINDKQRGLQKLVHSSSKHGPHINVTLRFARKNALWTEWTDMRWRRVKCVGHIPGWLALPRDVFSAREM
uniref:Putative secreted salivary protein salp15ir-2 n=1 Tax=Ixodes ricinus TaxID=34613 RepID=V5GG79_IXORI